MKNKRNGWVIILTVMILGTINCRKIPTTLPVRQYNPTAAFLLPGYPRGFFVRNESLWVADGQAGLVIIDLSSLPETLNVVGTFTTGITAYSVAARDSITILGMADNQGIWLINTANPQEPQFISKDIMPNYGYDVAFPLLDTPLVYLASGYWYIVEDISNLIYPSYKFRLHLPGNVKGIYPDSNSVWIASEEMGVYAVSSPLPDTDTIVCEIDTPNSAQDIIVSNGIAYVADGYGGLFLFGTNALSPIGSLDLNGFATDIDFANDTVYIACKRGGMYAVDATLPDSLRIVGEYSGYVYCVKVYKNYLIVGDRDKGLVVIER